MFKGGKGKFLYLIMPHLEKKREVVKQQKALKKAFCNVMVRMEGVEPTRLAALDPKSSASANFATSA